jgi:DNA-binding CsgD family transcriptional regulator
LDGPGFWTLALQTPSSSFGMTTDGKGSVVGTAEAGTCSDAGACWPLTDVALPQAASATPTTMAKAINRVRTIVVTSNVDPDAVRAVIDRRSRDVLTALTDRERDVLELMAEGRSNAAIGDRLGIGAKTVEARINAIFSKLGLEPATDDNRRVLAVLSFLREDPGG